MTHAYVMWLIHTWWDSLRIVGGKLHLTAHNPEWVKSRIITSIESLHTRMSHGLCEWVSHVTPWGSHVTLWVSHVTSSCIIIITIVMSHHWQSWVSQFAYECVIPYMHEKRTSFIHDTMSCHVQMRCVTHFFVSIRGEKPQLIVVVLSVT